MDTLLVSMQAVSDFFGNEEFVKFYAKNLRGNLFGGFLTVAAFLLSAKTFILIHLQKELYGTAKYLAQIRDLRKVESDLPFYGPLRRLGRLLFFTIAASLVASIAQLTVGLIDAVWAALLCVGLSVVALVLLSFSFGAISISLRDWFNRLEKDAAKAE